ncbi:MAG: cytochrome c [Rhodopila sp.]|nr:cytochrome c [Rhodopila sp.]
MTHDNTIRRRLGSVVVPLLILVASSQGTAAQDIGDVEAGRRLAETWCSNCHVVSPGQQRGTSNGAPTFTAIAAMKSTTLLALRAFLQTPHDRMPDLHMSRNEIDDVATYILSLRR